MKIKSPQYYLVLLISILLGSCSNKTIPNKTMKETTYNYYSEIQKKYNLAEGFDAEVFSPSDSANIEISYTTQTIQVKKYYRNGFVDLDTYYLTGNQSIMLRGNLFYQMEIGIWRYFDKSEKIIKEENYDKNFAFSLNDLIHKMKTEYNEDILSKLNLCSITRWENDSLLNRNIYVLNCWQTPLNKQHIYNYPDKYVNSYAIDGTTGETIQTSSFNLMDEGVYSAYHSYLIKLGLRTEDDYKPKPVVFPTPPTERPIEK